MKNLIVKLLAGAAVPLGAYVSTKLGDGAGKLVICGLGLAVVALAHYLHVQPPPGTDSAGLTGSAPQ